MPPMLQKHNVAIEPGPNSDRATTTPSAPPLQFSEKATRSQEEFQSPKSDGVGTCSCGNPIITWQESIRTVVNCKPQTKRAWREAKKRLLHAAGPNKPLKHKPEEGPTRYESQLYKRQKTHLCYSKQRGITAVPVCTGRGGRHQKTKAKAGTVRECVGCRFEKRRKEEKGRARLRGGVAVAVVLRFVLSALLDKCVRFDMQYVT
ncbi:hypothetical protein K440DRAFT_646175 [Wilcoxina mikolae CBS 423.85]|nr:hypothetical protein K440DRAFT_646175 [Wilcoxina mikolae CBS 423.85]